jgi:hypothetical protein
MAERGRTHSKFGVLERQEVQVHVGHLPLQVIVPVYDHNLLASSKKLVPSNHSCSLVPLH